LTTGIMVPPILKGQISNGVSYEDYYLALFEDKKYVKINKIVVNLLV